MTRHLISFGGASYDPITEKMMAGAQGSCDAVHVYDEPWLMNTDFYKRNQWLWDHHGDQHGIKRGFGWFCWKPFIILDALSRVDDGDIVMYLDADTYPVRSFGMLYEECARIGGVMLFGAHGFERFNYMWCKRDCFIAMGCDEDKYWFGPHGVARFMLFQKGPWIAQQFLMEWLTYCLNPMCQTFDGNTLANHRNIDGVHFPPHQKFREHRTEQAIMTNLAIKHGIRFYREACQFGALGETDRELYPEQLFHQGTVQAPYPKPLTGSKFCDIPRRTE